MWRPARLMVVPRVIWTLPHGAQAPPPGSWFPCLQSRERASRGADVQVQRIRSFPPSTGHQAAGSFRGLSSLTSHPLSQDPPLPQRLLSTAMCSFVAFYTTCSVYTQLLFVSPCRHEIMISHMDFNECM